MLVRTSSGVARCRAMPKSAMSRLSDSGCSYRLDRRGQLCRVMLDNASNDRSQILRLEVSVNDFLRMQVLHSCLHEK
jgi:hypothetical protein